MTQNDELLQISKLSAAKLQIQDAVIIYFSEFSPITLHTVLGAIYGILKPLLEYKNQPSVFYEAIPNYIIPEKVSWFLTWLHKPRNFFKHADKDPEDMLDFRPALNTVMLLFACIDYMKLDNNYPVHLDVFVWYCKINHPEYFKDNPSFFSGEPTELIETLDSTFKNNFSGFDRSDWLGFLNAFIARKSPNFSILYKQKT